MNLWRRIKRWKYRVSQWFYVGSWIEVDTPFTTGARITSTYTYGDPRSVEVFEDGEQVQGVVVHPGHDRRFWRRKRED